MHMRYGDWFCQLMAEDALGYCQLTACQCQGHMTMKSRVKEMSLSCQFP